MTDTTLGEESEMLHLQGIFAKAANAIVEASQLRKEVASLQVQMKQLSDSVEALRVSNEQLVNELTAIRQEKAELQGKLNSAEGEIHNLKRDLGFVTTERDGLREEVRGLHERLDSAHKDMERLTEAYNLSVVTIHKLRSDRQAIKDAYKKYIADSAAFEDVVYAMTEEPKAVQEVQPEAAPEEEVKTEAPVPFAHGNGEQPRAEDGKFEPVPMAARHFE